ncbi:hypothetical protein EG68_11819 [Paragonimus skrjabini miyazakii]|uniref:G-protein coupled receptors family 1 profile domain-containing protein n=1 Tax=Paragonimus skrjabini miyazakii TaxID=59628 RepID=A0A8S9YJR0_9TREM|nr:hypothetical protein EG68_11819 [Paragonimus skrjabini miyazakii]
MLLRSQCTVDGYTGFFAFLYQIFGSEVQTGSELANRIFCRIWYRDNLIWIGVILSVHNVVCISFDRFMAVVHPGAYKLYKKRLTIAMYTYLTLMCLFMFYPNILSRRYENGRCGFVPTSENKILDQLLDVESKLWIIFIYGMPAICVVVLHSILIWKIRKDLTQPNNSQSGVETSHEKQHTKQMQARVRRLTWTTVGMTCILLTFHTYDAFIYMLSSFGVVDYEPGSPDQQVGLILIVVCSCVIPCFLAGSIDSLRDLILHGLCRRVGKLSDSGSQAKTSEYE